MELNLINGIKLLAIFQAVFFSLSLLISKRKLTKSNFFIILFQLLLALNVGADSLPKALVSFLGNLYTLFVMSAFLIPPIVYFFVISSIDKNFVFKKKQFIHFGVFIVLNLILIPYVYLENYKENPTKTDFHEFLNKAFYVVWYCQFLFYLTVSFLRLKHHKKLYLERFSSSDISRFNYLNNFVLIVSIVFALSAFKNFTVYNADATLINYATYIVLFSLLVFFCWTTIMAIKSPEIFSNNDERLPLVKELIKVKSLKAKENNASDNPKIKLQIEKIKTLMESKEPFLDASFSLHDLANLTDIPIRELSIIINHHLNKHFFDFVNRYRIEKAKQLLISPDRSEYTVLEILYEVGFNSKSSFNTAFKKQTNLTPTQYRKSNIQKMNKAV